jgi:hypothetical protein
MNLVDKITKEKTAMSEPTIVYIDNWGITANPHYPTSEPCLCGIVTGHPDFQDGDPITASSPIQELRAGRVVTLSGTVYQLGKPHPNALSDAFMIKREFAYLVLLLCFIAPVGSGVPPAVAPRPAEPGTAARVLAFAASSRNDGGSSIQ